MLENWLPVLIFFIFVAGFGVTNLLLSWFIGVRKPTPVKLSPYESGMQPVGTARERYSVQYYIIAMLFLLFDVEAIFLFPWAVVYDELGMYGFWAMMIFLGALLEGFIYVWRKGALEWER